nr:MAG TPA: SNARE associated Golgi protein [Caudoviricetes sp.]
MKRKLKTIIKENKKTILRALLILVIITIIALSIYGIMKLCGIGSIENLREIANSRGYWVYPVIVILQIIQVVFIPLTNQLITVPAIVVVGMWPAFFCSWIGIFIGTIILYFIGKSAGSKLFTWVLGGDKEKAEKYENILKSRQLFYPIGMLIGAIPDDLLTLTAGMSNINFWYVCIVAFISRGICTLITVFSWGYLPTLGIIGWILMGFFSILLIVLAYFFIRYGDRIENWIKNKFKK